MVTLLIYLSSFVTWEISIVYLGRMLDQWLASLHVHEQAYFGLMLIRSDCNAICHLRAVQRIELKPFKSTTIEVAYAKRAMSKRWDGSQVHCTTHSSLWADLGTIMMDGLADLSSGSAE